MGDIAAAFQSAEIVPNIIPSAPKNNLTVNYEGTVVENGMKFKMNQLRFAPRVQFSADPESTYSMVMIDPDNLSKAKPTVAEWLHWLVVNIPASNMIDGIMGGQVLMAYGSPGPGPRTGEHRYIMLLYEHTDRRLAQPIPQQRAKFKVKAFQEKHNIEPIAGIYFTTQNDVQ